MLLSVGINLDEIMNTFEAILTKETHFEELDETLIISGQGKEDYIATMRITKMRCLSSLSLIYRRFSNLTLPFVCAKLPKIA